MNIAKFLAGLGVVVMTVAIANAFLNGDAGTELSQLLAMPWGIVSLVDLYTGFTLFSIWIAYREGSWLKAGVWIVLMMVLGFFTGALYMLIELFRCKGDWRRFWLGARA